MNELKPGSKEAVNAGCKCPVLDNKKGDGIIVNGKVSYWINTDCPIHANNEGYDKR